MLVTIKRAAELTGMTEKAIRRKIESGRWRQGAQYHRTPDGCILVDLAGFDRWARGGST